MRVSAEEVAATAPVTDPASHGSVPTPRCGGVSDDMAGPWPDADSVARFLLSLSVRLALVMTAAVVIERAVSAVLWARREYIQNRYSPLAHRALSADSEALRRLADIPARHRLSVARPLL